MKNETKQPPKTKNGKPACTITKQYKHLLTSIIVLEN